MIRRTTKIALEVAGGLMAATVLLLAVAIWRLSANPVDLNFLTPRIEEALADPVNGITVGIGTTQLVWGGWARTIDLHTRNVAVRGADGTTIAVLPDLVIGFSLRALVQGTLAPSAVDVFGARLHLIRGEDGKFQLGGPAQPSGSPESESDLSRLLPSIIAQLTSKPVPEQPLSFLTVLRIIDGKIFFEDRKSKLSWEAPGAVIELRREARGLTGEFGVAIDIGGTRATVTSDFTYDKNSGRIDLQGSAANLHPAALAWIAPQLQILAGLTTPLTASLVGSGRPDGTIDSLSFDLQGEQGQLTVATQLTEPVPIAQVRLRGAFNRAAGRLVLETGELDIGTPEHPGPSLMITGSVTRAPDDGSGDMDVEATVIANKVPMADLARYWPVGLGGNARTWVVDNVTQGLVDAATAQLGMRLPGGSVDAAQVSRLDGTLKYHDVKVHFMRPLPPVVEISGMATFDKSSMAFLPDGGRLGSLQVQPTAIDITGLDREDQDMAIDLAVVGPLRDALELLDHERLGLIRRLGIETAAVNGTAAARVAFRFPLIGDLSIDDIEIEAMANLEQASIEKFILGQDAREGQLSLTVTKAGMDVTGPLKLGGVGVELAWQESFTDDDPYRTNLAAEIPTLDEAGQRTFGIELSPYLTGPVSASIRMLTDHAGASTLSAAVNLQSATMAIAPLSWQKPSGQAGEAFLTLRLAAGSMAELSQFKIDAGSLRASGRGLFAEGSHELVALTLDDLAIDRTKVRKVKVTRRGEGYNIHIGGGIVDATSLFSGTGDEESKAAAKEAKAVPAAARTYTPLVLSSGKLDRLEFGPDRYFEAVSLDFDRGTTGWNRLEMTGNVPSALWSKSPPAPAAAPGSVPVPEPPRTLRIEFGPIPAGVHKLSVTAEDMGGVLRALDIADTVQGGTLDVTGNSDGPLPARPLKARIEARNYVLVNAPILASLLTVASLTGIVDLLRGDGITFTHLTGDVSLDDGVLTTDLVRAYGPALGLTVKGNLDFDESVADLQGTIVPAYTINRVLGYIPLLGQILVGGEGEGFLAFTYKITGPLAEPVVDVNALSALAPGFLRGLFGLLDANGAVSEENQPRAFPDRESR